MFVQSFNISTMSDVSLLIASCRRAGPPTQAGSLNGTCTNPSGGGLLSLLNGNNEGLWLFTRDITPSADTAADVVAAAAAAGFDLSVLVDVPQAGCLPYAPFPEPAPPPPPPPPLVWWWPPSWFGL